MDENQETTQQEQCNSQLQQEIEEILQQEEFLENLELTKDEIEFFRERAAIIEFDGKMPRLLAELMAKKRIVERRKSCGQPR